MHMEKYRWFVLFCVSLANTQSEREGELREKVK